MKPSRSCGREHAVQLEEPEQLERVHSGEALRLLGRRAEPFEPFTDLLVAPRP